MSASTITVPPRAAAVLCETHRTHRPAEQAALLGVSEATVWSYKAALYRAGVLRREDRAAYRPRTASDVERAIALARQGMLGREIAEILGRTMHDISEWLAPHGGLVQLRREGRAEWWSVEAVARMFSVHPSAVRRWVVSDAIEVGRTKDTPARRGRRRHWRGPGIVGGVYQITRPALADFIRVREYWMEYTASGIKDADLRRLAETVRSAAGGQWTKLRPIAGDCSPGRYSRLRAQGWPGTGWDVVRSGTTDWLWVVNGAALPSVPPPQTWKRRGEK